MDRYPKGTYVLRIELEEEEELEIGSLGSFRLSGSYLYVGSALGPGGLKRVTRHIEVASGEQEGGHWHVDYLTDAGKVAETWLIPAEADIECQLAGTLADYFSQPVEGFGASDCSCYSHLFTYEPEKKEELIREINRAIDEISPIRFDWK